MEDNFALKEDTIATTTEVDEVNAWNKTTTDDPVEAEILAEVNEVNHKYGRNHNHRGHWAPGSRPQGFRTPFRGGKGNKRAFTPQYNNPRHQNTTVTKQAYTFNGTTPNASVSYAPGTFNRGAPFSTYQVPYNQQLNQTYTQNQQYQNNSFADKQNNQTPEPDTIVLLEKLQQLLVAHKNPVYQVNEVKVVTPQPGTMWDLKAAAELPTAQKD